MSDDEIDLDEFERLLKEEGYSEAVREILARMTPREAKILRDKLNIEIESDGSDDELFDHFEATRRRIREIEQRGLRKLEAQRVKPKITKCSFCGKGKSEVKKLIESKAKPGVYICNECVEITKGLIDDD